MAADGWIALLEQPRVAFWVGAGAGAVVLLLVLLLFRGLAWRLFSFDRRIRATRHQLKSAEVRLGHLTETLAPLLDEFPVDITRDGTSTVFLGQPVDYVHFDPEEGVHFIEIKSAEARLSSKQRALRERVEEGAVFWSTLSVK